MSGGPAGRHARRRGPGQRGSPLRALAGLALIGSLPLWGGASAHEGHGHDALPSEGFRVDGETITLAAEARESIGLVTTECQVRRVERRLVVPARALVPPHRRSFAASRLPGRVASLSVRVGDTVAPGQVVSEVESLELTSLQVDALQAALKVELSGAERQRIVELVRRGILAEKDQLTAEYDGRDFENELRGARSKLEVLGLPPATIAQVLSERRPVRTLPVQVSAPGLVVGVRVNVGTLLDADDQLLEVHDMRELWVRGEVPEDLLGAIEVGQQARVRFAADPQRVYTGRIDRIDARVDEATRAVPVYVTLANPDLTVRPGQYAQLEVVLAAAEDAPAVPVEAVVERGERPCVLVEQTFVASGEAGYERVPVVLGIREGDWIEVVEGLFPGDLVVVRGNHQLASVLGPLTGAGLPATLMAQAAVRPLADTVEVNARVRAPTDRRAFSSVPAFGRVAEVLVREGEAVAPGQVLARIESLQLQNLQIELIQSLLRRDLLTTSLERLKTLRAIVPGKELLRLETEQRRQENLARGLSQRLLALGLSPEEVERVRRHGEINPAVMVRAPLGGVVVSVNAVLGQAVGPDEHLFEVQDPSVVWVEGSIFEEDLERVTLGQEVRLRAAAYPDQVVESRLTFTPRGLRAIDRVLPVIAEVPNRSGLLRVGMLVDMAIVVDPSVRQVMTLPRRAVQREDGVHYVAVREGPGFRRAPVTLGSGDDRLVEVRHGLAPGAEVAADASAALSANRRTLR